MGQLTVLTSSSYSINLVGSHQQSVRGSQSQIKTQLIINVNTCEKDTLRIIHIFMLKM